MDAFAITGVSPEHEWFRVQAAVGGIDAPARLFPRVHVVRSADIADLAAGGRSIYFQQGEPERPLVPLPADDAAEFEAQDVPLEDIPIFAFTETATSDDIEALLALSNGEAANPNLLQRLEALGWVVQDLGVSARLTQVGRELLRHRVV